MIAPLHELDQQDAFYCANYYSNATDADPESDLESLDSDGDSDHAESVCVPCGTPARNETSFDFSSPIVNLPISRPGISADDFTLPTSEEFVQAQQSDNELQLLRE